MRPDTITLPREVVALLLASAHAVYTAGHQHWTDGGARAGLRHLWSLSDAIEAAERAILEATDA